MTTAVGPEHPDNPPQGRNPRHIRRADLLAALTSIGITDHNTLTRVDVGLYDVAIHRVEHGGDPPTIVTSATTVQVVGDIR